MSITWMALYPGWYAQEREAISRRYPQFHVDTGCLDTGILRYYGELLIRPPGGTKRHAVQLVYPDATPFEPPIVTPIQSLRSLTRMVSQRRVLIHCTLNGGTKCLAVRYAFSSGRLAAMSAVNALPDWMR